MAPDWPQHHRSAACIVAQKYFSAVFGSLRFPSRDLKVDAPFKKKKYIYIISCCYFCKKSKSEIA
jgi:hypothetical protein